MNDDGQLAKIDADGNNVQNWNVSGDLEGLCLADTSSNFIYIGVENPDNITEFDFTTGAVTRSFDLTPWMIGPSNLGLEALTFVPDSTSSEGGFFYVGLQNDGQIYVFELPILSSSTSTDVTYMNTYTPVSGRADISGLHYEKSNETLYAIWDSANKLRAMDRTCSYIMEWDLPENDQEGITLCRNDGSSSNLIIIAEDTGKEVWKYDFNSELNITIIADGSVSCDPDTPAYYGSYLTLTAVPDAGYYFNGWSDDLSGSANPEILLMDYDKEVTAEFSDMSSPAEISIEIISDSFCISWQEVTAATSYNIYSNDDLVSEWEFEDSTADNSYNIQILDDKKFFRVRSVYE